MIWQRVFAVFAAVVLGAGAWRAGGWYGIGLLASALVLWFLLYYSRLLTVMRRAADRPIGYVGSAVMLNARLRTGQSLMHVVALTRSLGQLRSTEGAQPEVYAWSDAGGSEVSAEFANGKLTRWQLQRPAEPA